MNKQIFEKLEEKFVFKTSHIFFLVLVGAALLVMIGSVLIFLWGMTPSLKPGVEKAEYPPAVAVTADEVISLLPAPKAGSIKKMASSSNYSSEMKVSPEKKIGNIPTEKVDSTKIVYEQAIDSMKTLLPPKKHLWTNRGHYEYGYYKVRGNWRNGKHWVVDNYGIQAELNSVFRTIKVKSFIDKSKLINTYISVLNQFNEKNRFNVLKAMLLYSRNSLEDTKENMTLLAKSIGVFSADKTGYFYKLAKFGKKNPRDGHAFIGYIIQVMPKFDKTQRKKVLDKMIASYYKRYDNVDRQKEATTMFLNLLPKIHVKSQALALGAFYKLYDQKNQDRRYAIERINNQYTQDMSRAEMVLMEKQASKSHYRYQGLIGLGGGIVFIALVALILSLLSIQRNISELKMLSANNSNNISTHQGSI